MTLRGVCGFGESVCLMKVFQNVKLSPKVLSLRFLSHHSVATRCCFANIKFSSVLSALMLFCLHTNTIQYTFSTENHAGLFSLVFRRQCEQFGFGENKHLIMQIIFGISQIFCRRRQPFSPKIIAWAHDYKKIYDWLTRHKRKYTGCARTCRRIDTHAN